MRIRIDAGFVDGRLFANVVSGGFGSRVTAETDSKLKERLGALAYALTGVMTPFGEVPGNHGLPCRGLRVGRALRGIRNR